METGSHKVQRKKIKIEERKTEYGEPNVEEQRSGGAKGQGCDNRDRRLETEDRKSGEKSLFVSLYKREIFPLLFQIRIRVDLSSLDMELLFSQIDVCDCK